MNMFVWIGVHDCVDRYVWIDVRDVLGSIFVDPSKCIFRGSVSVNEYVCVDPFAWIGERGSLTEIPVLWICLYGSMSMDRSVLFA